MTTPPPPIKRRPPPPEAPTIVRGSAPLTRPRQTTSGIVWADRSTWPFTPSGYLFLPDAYTLIAQSAKNHSRSVPAGAGNADRLLHSLDDETSDFIQAAAERGTVRLFIRHDGVMKVVKRSVWNRSRSQIRDWFANCAINECPPNQRGNGHDVFTPLYVDEESLGDFIATIGDAEGRNTQQREVGVANSLQPEVEHPDKPTHANRPAGAIGGMIPIASAFDEVGRHTFGNAWTGGEASAVMPEPDLSVLRASRAEVKARRTMSRDAIFDADVAKISAQHDWEGCAEAIERYETVRNAMFNALADGITLKAFYRREAGAAPREMMAAALWDLEEPTVRRQRLLEGKLNISRPAYIIAFMDEVGLIFIDRASLDAWLGSRCALDPQESAGQLTVPDEEAFIAAATTNASPEPPGLEKSKAKRPLDKASVETWYRERVAAAQAAGVRLSRNEDQRAGREVGLGRDRVRELRREFAPPEWQDGGAPPKERRRNLRSGQ